MRASFFVCLIGLSFVSSSAIAQTQPIDWVNQYIGTANGGQTYPSVTPPFAMTAWSPETRPGNVKCVPPYYFADTRIDGFRGSHFMTGSCGVDYGDMTLMPLSGPLKFDPAARTSSFDRKTESATPYRYAVTLADYGIDAELTGTARSGLMRFRFRRSGPAWMLVESNSNKGEGSVQIDPRRNEILVVNPVRRMYYAGAGQPAGISGYFVVQFNRPFKVGGTYSAGKVSSGSRQHPGALTEQGGDNPPGAYVSFDLKPGDAVEARIGSSFTSLDEARRNLQAEIPGWDLSRIAAATKAAWAADLDKIQIQAPADQKHIFYTALYHSLLLPRTYSDVDGTYPRFAAQYKTETAKGFTYYCDFSMWDTFRAVHPMLTILDPDRERDMVRSLIAEGRQGGFLPAFPMWNNYTAEMVGDHAVTVIVDAYMKGIRGFDAEEAYRLMKQNATELPASHDLYVDGQGRRGLESYLKYGYIPLEDPVLDAFHKGEQVSRTLEYAYDDSVIGRMAQALGHTEDAALFAKRAENYRNVIDPTTGFARGRHADGSWSTPFDPGVAYHYITEGLPYQYTFFAPQDVPGLIQATGGRQAFISKLDGLFAGGYYNHGNEPSHHITYLYDYAGAAWKTQQHVRTVMDTLYSNAPDGLAGNDDAGQMSAWYVLSALGFYPVSPGTPDYQIGTPRFDDAVIHAGSGKLLHIHAAGASAGKFYIHAVTLNGVPLHRYWIKHSEIEAGGELVFTMSAQPDPAWPGK
jgi:predicted alpha-1,2-mannosidase